MEQIKSLLLKLDLKTLLIIVLIGYSIFNTNSIRTDIKGYEQRIESVQAKIDSTQVLNKQIDTKIDLAKANVVSITKEVNHIDNAITIIKNNTNEKVNNINHIGNAELELLFSARYNQSGVIH